MDKELLFKRKARETHEEVDLGGGAVVTVRALTRGEVADLKDLQEKEKFGDDVFELHLMAASLIDPVMTFEEVVRWITGDPDDPDDEGAPVGDSQTIMVTVSRLSGMTVDARKSVVPPNRKQRRRRV